MSREAEKGEIPKKIKIARRRKVGEGRGHPAGSKRRKRNRRRGNVPTEVENRGCIGKKMRRGKK